MENCFESFKMGTWNHYEPCTFDLNFLAYKNA